MKTLPDGYKPSVTEAQKYFRAWDELPNYCAHEAALTELFRNPKSPFRLNDNLSSIIIKTSTLNDFYSTNIRRVYDVAKTILNTREVDKRLRDGDPSLVEDIRKVTFTQHGRDKSGKIVTKQKEVDNYSFATKFCSHHQPDKFPIYDSYVVKVLCSLRKMYPEVFNFKKADLRNYATYKEQLDKLRTHFGLETLTYKDLDRYLWQLGKRYFSPYVDAVNGKIDYDNL